MERNKTRKGTWTWREANKFKVSSVLRGDVVRNGLGAVVKHRGEPRGPARLGSTSLELELKDCHIHHYLHDTGHTGGAQCLVVE